MSEETASAAFALAFASRMGWDGIGLCKAERFHTSPRWLPVANEGWHSRRTAAAPLPNAHVPAEQRTAILRRGKVRPPIAHKLAFALPSTSARPRSAGEVRSTHGVVNVLERRMTDLLDDKLLHVRLVLCMLLP